MKYYPIIAFASAFINFTLGISIGCGKLKGFVNTNFKKPERYFIAIGIIMIICGFVSLSGSSASILLIIIATLAESVILSLMIYRN